MKKVTLLPLLFETSLYLNQALTTQLMTINDNPSIQTDALEKIILIYIFVIYLTTQSIQSQMIC
jgi:hypothetical protein